VVNELIAKLEAANAKIKQYEGDREMKKRKQGGFKLSDLVDENGAHSLVVCKDAFCKKVMAAFKTRYPDRESFKRHGAVCLFDEDRAAAADVVKEEYARLVMDDALNGGQ
jgi:hypothetical protein